MEDILAIGGALMVCLAALAPAQCDDAPDIDTAPTTPDLKLQV